MLAFDQLNLKLGPFTLQAFGAIAAIAVAIGLVVVRRRAVDQQLEPMKARRLVSWVLVTGFFVAHLFALFTEHAAREVLSEPLSVLRVWSNLSVMGGFLGAALGAWLYNRRHPLGAEAWRYLDVVAYAFVVAWGIVRIGCFLAFDHPGQESTFFLAQVYRDGLVRHNFGLYEAIYFVLLAPGIRALGRPRRAPGFFVGLLAVLYAPFRFLLDFAGLAELEGRLVGLSPAQWGCLILVIVGGVILRRAFARGVTMTLT